MLSFHCKQDSPRPDEQWEWVLRVWLLKWGLISYINFLIQCLLIFSPILTILTSLLAVVIRAGQHLICRSQILVIPGDSLKIRTKQLNIWGLHILSLTRTCFETSLTHTVLPSWNWNGVLFKKHISKINRIDKKKYQESMKWKISVPRLNSVGERLDSSWIILSRVITHTIRETYTNHFIAGRKFPQWNSVEGVQMYGARKLHANFDHKRVYLVTCDGIM
jgi:hypothetical protein